MSRLRRLAPWLLLGLLLLLGLVLLLPPQLGFWLALGLLLSLGLVLLLPSQLDARLNRVIPHQRATPSARARALHDSLVVMDWHADSLLWKRDLTRRNEIGHVDLPRLVEGGVAIQMFTAVTRFPAGVDYAASRGRGPDLNTLQALVQRWPPTTWRSLEARALYQARKLRRWAEAAPEKLMLVRSAADLEDFLRGRATHPRRVAGMLGVEGREVMRRRFRDDILTLTLPMPLFQRMEKEADDCIFQIPSWKKLVGKI
jgi:hypothetical protein